MALSKIKMPKINASFRPITIKNINSTIKTNYRSTVVLATPLGLHTARNFSTRPFVAKVIPSSKKLIFDHDTKLVLQTFKNNRNQRNNSSSNKPPFDDPFGSLLKQIEGVTSAAPGGFFTTGYFYLIIAGLIIGFFFLNPVTQVPAGHIGLIDLFGSVSERTLEPGLNLVNPLAKVVKLSTKTQLVNGDTEVPSKEGLNVGLEVNLLYRLNPAKAREIYTTVGKDYEDIVVVPQFKSAIRQVTSTYDAKALYTAETRAKMGAELVELLKSLVEHRGIVIEEAPLKRVALPKRLTEAIEDKLSAEQQSQRMEFVLQKEKLEAERKAIEASGIARFQKIVAEGVSEQLLKWKGIEATEKLADSPNAKIVVIGGRDGLPLIFNADEKKK